MHAIGSLRRPAAHVKTRRAYGHHAALALPQLQALSPAFHGIVELIYWILPKPADLGMLLFDALQAGNSFSRVFDYQALQSRAGSLRLQNAKV